MAALEQESGMTFDNNRAESIRQILEKNLPRYLKLLRKMVGINSYTENREGINRLGAYTARLFKGLGFSSEYIESVNPLYGRHLFMRRPGKSGATIACVSHLDTVFTSEEEKENDFSWRVDGDIAYGPGTIDIKGGTLVMLMTLEALRISAPDIFNSVTWMLFFDASEETDSGEFAEQCRQRLPGDALACLVFEAGRVREGAGYVVTSRKGRAVFKIETDGRGAHSGVNHGSGANAVVQLAHIVGRLQALTDYDRGLTVNVGTFHGGTTVNRVPEKAEALVEVRAFNKEIFRETVEAILAYSNFSDVASVDGSFSCRTRVELLQEAPVWPENIETDRLFASWQEAGELLGLEVHPEKRGGLSDGNYLWHLAPTIDGLGPAGDNAHRSSRLPDGAGDQEYLLVPSLVPRALLNAMAIIRMAVRRPDE
jgi:glutamate carboxypeptidase